MIMSQVQNKIYTAILFSTFLIQAGFAQTPIKKEVEVVKPYEPVVSDAYKINTLPKISDSVVIHPSFNYNIVPTMVQTEFEVSRINAAKMVSPPLTKLYKSYLKLGLGNYSTPMAEIYINSLRSKKHSAGIFLEHKSSGGKVTLDNKQKAYAGYSNSGATLFGKRYFSKSYLYADGGIKNHTVFDYGYNPEITDTILEKGEIRQFYLTAFANAGIRSSHNDSSRLFYNVGVGYKYLQDRFKFGEHAITVVANGNKVFKKSTLNLRSNLNFYKPNAMLDSSRNSNILLSINPYVGMASDEYRLNVGFDLSMEQQFGKNHLHIYPVAELNFNVVKSVLIGLFGVYGEVKSNPYQAITAENPFIKPGLLAKNSNVQVAYYGGVKGSLGSKASYIAKVTFSKIKNDLFFINDSTTTLQNQFIALYDNDEVVQAYAGMNYEVSEKLDLGVKANYYQYTLQKEQYAWHRQNFDLTLSSKYNLQNKILVDFDVIYIGKRYAKQFDPLVRFTPLPSVLDFNAGIEYRYTKILSFWLKFNNFTAAKYQQWNQYPNQRFNMMVGLTYSM